VPPGEHGKDSQRDGSRYDGPHAGPKTKLNFAMQVLRDELQLEPKYPGFNGNQNN
jgi:hypothetical protein